MTFSNRAARSQIRSQNRLTRNAEAAARTLRAGGETLEAARDVVAARMEILACGLADPGRADLAEMSLMGAEKAEALSAAMGALAHGLGRAGGRIARGAAAETEQAVRAVSAAAAARTPAELAQAQADYAFGWWGRAASQMAAVNRDLLRAQSEALKPIHAAATANARRLKR